MNSDTSPGSSTSAFEDFLAGKSADSPAQGKAGVIVPPAAQDDPGIARIVANIRAELTHQVRSETTAVLPVDMTVRARGNVGEFTYRPDLIVDADLPQAGSISARNPMAIFEVAAAGSERAAFIEQWQVYRALPTLGTYVSVDSARRAVVVCRRAGEGWKTETFEDADDQFILPAIHGLLSLKTIYAGVFAEEEEEG